jgi:hypothetical protein
VFVNEKGAEKLQHMQKNFCQEKQPGRCSIGFFFLQAGLVGEPAFRIEGGSVARTERIEEKKIGFPVALLI